MQKIRRRRREDQPVLRLPPGIRSSCWSVIATDWASCEPRLRLRPESTNQLGSRVRSGQAGRLAGPGLHDSSGMPSASASASKGRRRLSLIGSLELGGHLVDASLGAVVVLARRPERGRPLIGRPPESASTRAGRAAGKWGFDVFVARHVPGIGRRGAYESYRRTNGHRRRFLFPLSTQRTRLADHLPELPGREWVPQPRN